MSIQKLYIIGAGSGDADLLTMKAHKILTSYPDVVIYDRLLSDDITSLIPNSAEKIYAGKKLGHNEMTQDEINAALVHHAKLGKKVVRLKGGDPFIFGRGGEECEILLKNNIPFEVIPGVTTALAAAASFAIPLTHREFASSVEFISGHKKKDLPLTLNYQKIADENKTLVIYMALKNIQEISEGLIKAGLAEGYAIAAIESAGIKSKERIIKSTLKNIAADTEKNELKSPVIFIVGKVVSLML
jgi:uroporphyrin-III C-methyltransferase